METYDEMIICNQDGCLNCVGIWCMKDMHKCTPNTKECKNFESIK